MDNTEENAMSIKEDEMTTILKTKYKKIDEEIQTVAKTIERPLMELRERFPQVGFMVDIGFLDGDYHYHRSLYDIDKTLAAEIVLGQLQEPESPHAAAFEAWLYDTFETPDSERLKSE